MCLLFQILFRITPHLCSRKRKQEYKSNKKEDYEEDCIFIRWVVCNEHNGLG